MGRRQRSNEQLQEQAKHLLYEIQMFGAITNYIRTREVDQAVAHLALEGLPARNAIVESFETHARNLIEFLTHQRGGRKTTAAGDYTQGAWTLPVNTADLKKLREQFSQRVAHLSWRRRELSEAEQEVRSGEIFTAIENELQRFLKEADLDKLSDGFLEAATAALKAPIQRGATGTAAWQHPDLNSGGTATQGIQGPTTSGDGAIGPTGPVGDPSPEAPGQLGPTGP